MCSCRSRKTVEARREEAAQTQAELQARAERIERRQRAREAAQTQAAK